jgi:hypothetical protein
VPGNSWFTGVADELARCLVDAEHSADACEAYLETLRTAGDAGRKAVGDALIAPAAVSRVLIDLIDQPAELVLAAARLCRDTSFSAAERLDAAGGPEGAPAAAALRRAAESCALLLDVA